MKEHHFHLEVYANVFSFYSMNCEHVYTQYIVLFPFALYFKAHFRFISCYCRLLRLHFIGYTMCKSIQYKVSLSLFSSLCRKYWVFEPISFHSFSFFLCFAQFGNFLYPTPFKQFGSLGIFFKISKEKSHFDLNNHSIQGISYYNDYADCFFWN